MSADTLNRMDSVEVLQVLTPSDAALIKSLLDAENISYTFYDESMMNKSWGAAKARLFVHKTDVEKAVVLLKDVGMI